MGRAITMNETGGPEVLELVDLDPGEPGPGTVRIRCAAAGVNFIDTYFRTGLYPVPLPFVLGLEGAGRIEAVGEGVQGLATGDLVAWATVPGSYGDALIAPADMVVRVPDGVEAETAAAAMLQGMTAHYLTHGLRETEPGDTALVHAAGGGTGQLLVQTLKEAGATVYGTCSTETKARYASEAGCAEVIRYDERDFTAEIARLTDGRGVDVVYDSVGKTTFDGSLSCVRPRGMMALFGYASGPVPPFDLHRLNLQGSVFITRPSLAHYTQDRAELELRANTVLEAIRTGKLRVLIGERFPLEKAAEAQTALEGRKTVGKVLLTC